jgi:type IV secretory pathway protease TraF
MKEQRIYRQGDVLLIEIDALPPEAAEIECADSIILAWGEATGHKHQIDADTATLYSWQGDRLIETRPGATLVHEEHSAIALKPALYRVVVQREYQPGTIRPVID